MAGMEFLFLIPGPPVVSALLSLIVLATLLYLAREPFHRMALTFGRVLHRGFRHLASWVGRAEESVVAWNREALLTHGRAEAERAVEREFEQLRASVDRELRGYPELHRELSDQIRKIDEDFQESAKAPEGPSTWIEAVEAVAKLRDEAGPHVAAVLAEIHKSMVRAQKKATREYRRVAAARHRRLGRLRPAWRRIQSTLDRVERDVNELVDRAKRVDRRMEQLRELDEGSDRVVRTLASSAITRFVIATVATCVVSAGALLNFFLLARPLRAMVSDAPPFGQFLVADVGAVVIILVGLSMGLFLMEALRITQLFPGIGALDDQRRRWLARASFGLLSALAVLGSTIALMREILTTPELGLTQTLTGQAAIPLAVHMALAFVLPFALAFVAIPLESLVRSGRTVAGMVLVGALRALRVGLHTVGGVGRGLVRLVPRIYDLLIFAPLWIERVVLLRRQANREPESAG